MTTDEETYLRRDSNISMKLIMEISGRHYFQHEVTKKANNNVYVVSIWLYDRFQGHRMITDDAFPLP